MPFRSFCRDVAYWMWMSLKLLCFHQYIHMRPCPGKNQWSISDFSWEPVISCSLAYHKQETVWWLFIYYPMLAVVGRLCNTVFWMPIRSGEPPFNLSPLFSLNANNLTLCIYLLHLYRNASPIPFIWIPYPNDLALLHQLSLVNRTMSNLAWVTDNVSSIPPEKGEAQRWRHLLCIMQQYLFILVLPPESPLLGMQLLGCWRLQRKLHHYTTRA